MTDFALRIFITDHYFSKPLENVDHIFNDFTKTSISQVPIIVIFGSTPKGQKVCAHIHGVYPYFYVPFFEDVSLILNKERLDKFLLSFATSLSSAINMSMGYSSQMKPTHIFRVTLVKGKPFYGYQEHFQYFLKIYLYNPMHIKKAGDLLLNGAVMNRVIQPYETHIPYNLKFFIDYNLYGMNYLYTDAAMFRVNNNYCPDGSFIDYDVCDSVDLSQRTWNIDQLPPDCMMDEKVCSKMSHCELEVDICACDILNIEQVQNNIGENPGLKDLWEEEKQRRIALGLDLSELVGEVFEERPIATSTESELALMKEWENVCANVKRETELSQEVDAFIGESDTDTEENEDQWDLNESVNEDSIMNAVRTGDSFVLEAVVDNNDFNDEDDREMCEFINACIKMEEEDSIIPEAQSDVSSIATIEKIVRKFPSLSQHTSSVIDLANDSGDSDEDLFDQTFIDLSQDDSDNDVEGKGTHERDTAKCTASSDDLFEDADSIDINGDSDSSEVKILMTHDGADDEDDSGSDVYIHRRKRQKTDPTTKTRTPVITRSKNKFDSRGQPIKPLSYFPEKQKQPKIRVRKQRPSLSLKNCEKLTDQSILYESKTKVETNKAVNTNDSNVLKVAKKEMITTPCFVDLSGSITEIISVADTQTEEIKTKHVDANKEVIKNKKNASRRRERLSLTLKDPRCKPGKSISMEIDEAQTSVPVNAQRSTQIMFSTPLRPNLAPLNSRFTNISPIMKSSSNTHKRERTVSFSIPEVSQELLHKTVNGSQLSQKLEELESMKKTVSQGIYEMSQKVNYLSKRFEVSMMSHLTVMSAEVQCASQSNLLPNPISDPVLMFLYAVYHEPDLPSGNVSSFSVYEEGLIVINSDGKLLTSTGIAERPSYRITNVATETDLFDAIVNLVLRFDPDLLLGYETTRCSWGYVLERAFHTKHKLFDNLSRLYNDDKKTKKNKECSFNELHCKGRVILDLWIILKHELTLTSYTVENVVDDVLKERVPFFTNQQLMAWYRSNHDRYRVVDYWKYRVSANLRLVSKLDVISRASEFAKIYGIEFYHVLSRGSQYRVESMMLRLAKPQNLIALSPSIHQRTQQKAPECIPLTLEPRSGFYKDPVVVLDFQSLYPSIMIAYNLCFSTSVGKLANIRSVEIGDQFEFGCGQLHLEVNTIKNVESEVNITPNEVVFVKPPTFKGIISKMVEEILTTRIMVKKSMKIHKDNKSLCKVLDSRQLGLKLIANVTYGYTAAGYSGRMPCVEVGDSIIRKSRETLEESIQLVASGGPDGYPLSDEQGGWKGCEVIYGDTDSLFIVMPGRTKEQAFTLGARMADAVTARNPFPVKLKFEKVFLPCLLESKKRYVGYSYETLDQEKPIFLAKGIETVRRDNCNIVGRILERTLHRLFDNDSMDSIKRYVTSELDKVLSRRVNLTDFIFAKEYRGRSTYKPGAAVPALHIANEMRKKDIRSEPLSGQRVQYVIVQGEPGDTLRSCVRQPCELLFDTKWIKSYNNNIRSLSEQGCQLNFIYYITKQILPPLNRALSLLGVDVFKWYSLMPKNSGYSSTAGRGQTTVIANGQINRTISSYFISKKCMICGTVIKHANTTVSNKVSSVLCDRCLSRGKAHIYVCGTQQVRDIEDLRQSLVSHCNMCTNTTVTNTRGIGPPCVSTDCATLFDRVRAFQTPTEHWERLLQSNLF